MTNVIGYLIMRLTEPSSMAGVAAIIDAAGKHNTTGIVQGVIGLLAVVVPEGWKPEKTEAE